MRKIFTVLTVLMIGVLLFAGCGIPKEVQNELTQLRNEKQQWVEWELELEQLRAEKKKWEEVEKLALEKQVDEKDAQIREFEAQVAELAGLGDISENPSYDEVKKFLSEDRTERARYQRHETYTYHFLMKARAQGLRGYPVVVFTPERILVFAGFNTIDKGWIYILPAIDKEVSLVENKSYQQLNNDYRTFGSRENMISKIMIFE